MKRLLLTLVFLIVSLLAFGGCPPWVKEGLTVSYRAQLLAGGGQREKFSGSTGSGNALFITEGINGGKPYGHFFLFVNTYGRVFEKSTELKREPRD